jgi:hypothetical protein
MSGFTFFEQMENIVKKESRVALELALHYYGIQLKVFQQEQGVTTQAYGSAAGGEENYSSTIEGILVGDDFFEEDSAFSGGFNEGFLYTISEEKLVGAIVQVDSQDGKARRYRVRSKKSIGTTTEVFTRYELTSVGD